MKYSIYAFGLLCDGFVADTTMLEGEITYIIHFFHPHTGEEVVTTRKA